MKVNNCDLVNDLFPNYIENLTSENTNNFIENHIKECDKCSKIYKELNDTSVNNDDSQKFINYAKKYNIKFNFWRILGVLIIFFCIITVARKIIIIENLLIKSKQFENEKNYYSMYNEYDEKNLTVIESYCYDYKYYRKLKTINKISGQIINIIEEKYDGNNTFVYSIDEFGNSTNINTTNINNIMPIEVRNYYLENNNMLDRIKNYIFCNIKSTNCNGIECYRFTNLYNSQSGNNDYVYINKETGLPIRVCNQDIDEYNEIKEFSFEINVINESEINELIK